MNSLIWPPLGQLRFAAKVGGGALCFSHAVISLRTRFPWSGGGPSSKTLKSHSLLEGLGCLLLKFGGPTARNPRVILKSLHVKSSLVILIRGGSCDISLVDNPMMNGYLLLDNLYPWYLQKRYLDAGFDFIVILQPTAAFQQYEVKRHVEIELLATQCI